MGIRFVTGDTVRLPLSDGDWIQIKQQLSHGERDAMFVQVRANEAHGRTAEVVAYLLGWSSTERYSLALPIEERLSIIDNLDTESFDEIQAAIKTHLDARAQEKKRPNGSSESAPILPSVGGLVGAMSG